MKKLLIIVAALGAASMCLAQNLRLDRAPDTLTLKPIAVREFENSSWRTGLAFPIFNLRDGKVSGYPSVATVDAWVLSDASDFKSTFLGAGLDVPVFTGKNMRLGLAAGWSANFSNLEHIDQGRWGVGASLTIRF